MVSESSKERLRLAKSISLIGLIKELGYTLEETSGYYRMTSPFRSEGNPSFDINKRKVDKWRDRGTNQKGDVVDFVKELFHYNTHDAINYLLEKRQIAIPVYESVKRDLDSILITHVGDIISPALIDYLAERRISLKVAHKWLVELKIQFPYGKYPERITTILGFKSDSGGYEMRNRFLKVCNSPKNVTTIKGDSDYKGIAVYEGSFSFLSHATIVGDAPMGGDAVVLNSLSFLPQMLSFWDKSIPIFGFLDNDDAGDKATQSIIDAGFNLTDMRYGYKDFNDLNDMLCGKPLKKKIKSIKELLQ
jgi:hypothetical protein